MGLTEENWSPSRRQARHRICRPCNTARLEKWAKENPEKNRARIAQWHKENPEKNRAAQAKWRKAHPDKHRARVAKDREGVPAVYVIVNPAWPDFVKIGRTRKRASVRLSQLNTGDPLRRYTYVAFVPVDDDRAAEKQLHDTLSADRERLDGEWFKAPVEVAVRLAESLRKRSSYENDNPDS